ncbi:hypothetical protein SAMN05444266_10437 [Chitinophaga jiangningensis]|uniref:Uncharacterized protein n=1 Tax=Chitinophaga jiangningensis TaxID=1419482 RepID=A0A1M7BS31_9BACT|nr:hypothetical protein [Chitinophaga jiangningensis]SHL57848.1 hypothetical protein SAMN05444266_10437 [Chitinophaga jiangningensis]
MMQQWTSLAIGAGVILLGVLLWQEYKRASKHWLAARLLATTLAVVSLVALGIRHSSTAPTSPGNKRDTTTTSKPVFTSGYWEKTLPYLAPMRFQGKYHNTTDTTIRLHLTYAGIGLDSTTVAAGSDTTVNLQTVPPFLGSGMLQLLAISNKDTTVYPLPVEVMPEKRISVLFIAGSPGFENRFLADWLATQGMPVAMRSRVATSKYVTRFNNMNPVPLDAISTKLLEQFDVVMADPEALTASEKNLLQATISTAYKGLVYLADSTHGPLKGTVLLKDSLGKPSVTITPQGMGRLLQLGSSNTFAWKLQGDTLAYGHYWATVLSAAAGNTGVTTALQLLPFFATINNNITISLKNTGKQTDSVLLAGQVRLPLAQDALLEDHYTATWWPSKTGWHTFRWGTETYHGYIFAPGEWAELREEIPAGVVPASQDKGKGPINWYWILPLLASCIFLWLEKKL